MTDDEHTTRIQSNMSVRIQNFSRRTSCGWCKNLGLSPEEYNSHTAKNCDGEVICPRIIANVCNDCGETGHTPKTCPANAERKRAERSKKKEAAYDEDGMRIVQRPNRKRRQCKEEALLFDNRFTVEVELEVVEQEPEVTNKSRFACEHCGFEHSCYEVVEDHESKCRLGHGKKETVNIVKSYLAAAKTEAFSWADDEGEMEFNEDQLWPSL